MKKFFENKPRAWFVVGLVVVMILVLFSLGVALFTEKTKDLHDPNILAVVGREKITRSSYNSRVYGTNLIGSPVNPVELTDPEKISFLDELIEDSIIRQESSRAGVTVDLQEVENKTKTEVVGYEKMTKAQQEAIFSNRVSAALKQKFKEALIKKSSGEYVLFRFDKYYLFGEKDFEGEGDQNRINAQKEYALKFSQEIYQKIISREISFEKAKELVAIDKEIGLEASLPNTPNLSGFFSEDEYQDRLGYFDSKSYSGFLEKVSTMKAGEISEPFIVKGFPSGTSEDGPKEIFLAIVKVDKVSGGQIPMKENTYEEWLEAKKNEYYTKAFYNKLSPNIENKEYHVTVSAPFISTAYAESIDCEVAFAGTHYTAFNMWAYYVGADNVAHVYPNFRVTIGAGPYDKTYMKGANSNCSDIDYYGYSDVGRNAYASGRMMSSWAGSTNYGWFKANTAYCAATSTGRMYFHNTSPALSGDIPSLGRWEFVTSTYNRYGVVGQTYDSAWLNTSSNYYDYYDNGGHTLYVPLDMSTSTSWANGTTITKRAVYIPHWNNPPIPTVYNPGTITIPNGSLTANVAFSGYSSDPDGDGGKLQIMWKKSTEEQWHSFGINNDPAVPSGSLASISNGVTTPNINEWGWSHNSNPAPSTGWVPNGAPIYLPAVSLTAGEYVVAARVVDEQLSYSGWVTKNFVVLEPAIPTLACLVNPSEGPVPLVVTVGATATNLTSNIFDYQFQRVRPDISSPEVLTGRGPSVYYTLPGPGYYQVWVRNSTYLSNQWVQCNPAEVNVTEPTDPDGGEVAP